MTEHAVIHVVDDDDSLRSALQRLLTAAGYAVRAFASAGEFLLDPPTDAAGCLVLDLCMPGPSGLELQEALERHGIRLPVIFLTGHGDLPSGVRAMKAGAVDFITKPVNDQALVEAIQRAILQDDRDRQSEAERVAILRRVERLTPREREVFALVVAGKLNKQIAHQLGTSEKTIKVHRARVMDKMQAESLADLVLLAQAAGLCKPKVQSG